jgi:ThiF family
MTDHRTENARTLASLLNLSAAEAAPLLDVAIAVRADPVDSAAMAIASHLQNLLSHTVADVPLNIPRASIAAEVVIGAATPTLAAAVRVHVSPAAIQISPSAPSDVVWSHTHPVILLVAACYAAGAILRTMFGDRLRVPGSAESIGLMIPIVDIVGSDRAWLSAEFELIDTYLAGAGAIGNGFLYALSLLRASGTLVIVDPDIVSDGNLNRCVWFTSADIKLPKAIRLSELAQPSFPVLHLIPKTKTLQQVGREQPTDTWLKRLIVAVDSRRTRRHLQHEIPGEVFDASTTGAVECVFHHHMQPTDDACLACIYHETPDELARERHMAETLGVELSDVKEHYVSPNAAGRIHARYSLVSVEELKGQAYDTLFKALCSEGKLLSIDNRQVLAPFAFVSVLAGTYLAIELGRRIVLGKAAHDFNYWRISPWAPPFVNMRDARRRRGDCEFCGQSVLLRTARGLWGL